MLVRRVRGKGFFTPATFTQNDDAARIRFIPNEVQRSEEIPTSVVARRSQ
jgi:hypothetical protein